MCGVLAIIRTDGKDARKTALKRYEAQAHRGTEGYGFVAIKDNKLIEWARTETEDEIREQLEKIACDTLIFHHRTPTSTPNLAECNHPIKVSNDRLKYDYYVIHNGIIWHNESERLKKKHEAEGYKYTTEVAFFAEAGTRKIPINTKWNDSEAMAIEMAQSVDEEKEGFKADGSIAFIAAQVEKETGNIKKILWGSNGQSPLKFFEVKDVMITIASEGAGDEVDTNVLYSLDFTTGEIAANPYIIGSESYRGGYPQPVVTIDYEEDYYDALEEIEEQKRKRAIAEFAGEDTIEYDDAIEVLNEDLLAMERSFDEKGTQAALLNG